MSVMKEMTALLATLVCIVRRQPRETVGVKRPLPHRLGDGSNLGSCPPHSKGLSFRSISTVQYALGALGALGVQSVAESPGLLH